VWLLGWVPAATTTAAPPGPTAAQLAAARLRADEADVQARLAEKQRDELARKADAAAASAKKAAADLKSVAGQLATARAAADQAKQAKERADALAEQVRQADAKRAELAASVEALTADKAAAEAKVRTAEATAARLRDQAEKADQAAKAARVALDRATAATKQAATFAADVAHRLRQAPESAATDLLAALDRALARPSAEPGAAGTDHAAVRMEPVTTPQQVQYAAHAGYAALRSGNSAAAEREFARLAASPERTAIHFYLLGLAQWRQGENHDAEESFRRGWALERDSKPSPADVEVAFERLDRSEREVVNRYRQ
jgi:hypothetical protein